MTLPGYVLVYSDGGETRTFALPQGGARLGRSSECELVLASNRISRQHARITTGPDGAELIDLGSKNGTKVNGRRVDHAPLHHGDRIELGDMALRFLDDSRARVDLSDSGEFAPGDSTIIRRAQAAAEMPKPGAGPPAAAPTGESSGRILPVLNDFARDLLGVHRLDELLRRVIGMMFDYLPADRGCVMLLDDADQTTLVPMVSRQRDSSKATQRIAISKTICRTAMRDGVSILTSDARFDGRFNAEDSIRLSDIHSAMCAPLRSEGRSIGVIYVDSPIAVNCFDGDDLDLLTALANFTAIAVERARMHQQIVDEERRRRRLGRFVSPQVAARVLASSNDDRGPEQREVSVLFADLVGFTGLSERLGPETVAFLLSEFFSRMTDAIFQYEGMLDKFIGDAVMAVFGAPLDMPDHAQQAVHAALAMKEQMEAFNAMRSGEEPLRMRVGINSGRVVAAEIGSVNKREYTVLGDTVNVASRLESSVAEPGMIVIGPRTHSMVSSTFDCRSLGTFKLKGKQASIEAFAVEGLRRGKE